ncbi:MAG: aminodeoxychorismate synthase component I [Pirellulaceae bacterium]|jgi:para-aminobenzoate synthetase component 1
MPTPWIEDLPGSIGVAEALERLWDQPWCCLLESALAHPQLGRYSFLAVDPFQVFRVTRPQADPFAELAGWMERFQTDRVPELPPFQGGAAGYFGYELGRCFERVPRAKHDEFALPLAVVGLYDLVVAWDHLQHRGWIISQGYPESDPQARAKRAAERGIWLSERLRGPAIARPAHQSNLHATAHGLTAPQYQTRLGPAWLGNFDSSGYQAAVEQAREAIYSGDIFQVNLSQRLLRRSFCHAVDLYLEMRRENAATFAGYFDLGPSQIVSASPERFLRVDQGWVETRPIKGTRRRSSDPQVDAAAATELLTSEKDRAENVMIVDLLRNDLSRVCEPDSVQVERLCGLESYPFVHHLVSVVRGRLAGELTPIDLLAASFPGGSITGAPKIRAMEIIADLEPTARGAYCGSLGYWGWNGTVDWNILIRTITASRGWWQFQVGGGIVADSQAAAEEEETWTKAAGLVRTIESLMRRAIR